MTVSPAAVLVELQHVVRLLGGLVVCRPRPAAARAHVTKHHQSLIQAKSLKNQNIQDILCYLILNKKLEGKNLLT